ncbi:MAG TPA: phosphoglycerate mutase family protein [Ferruginibacter sp.]|nr:phosphoglycerate mutase family protein [Ferruginibacter sp.]HRE63128.1 phosphoglycerate mutase family protein [Ferruginibacter sp.]
MNKYYFSFFLIAALSFTVETIYAQQVYTGKRTLYIVRHAEKDTGTNPAISTAGKQRAGDLYRSLKNKKIDLIMASQYRRTGMTADSIRLYQGIDSIQYKADESGDDFLKTLLQRAGKAKNILVVGHSNTLPAIIRKAGVTTFSIKELPETEFDNLFMVIQKKGKAKLKQKKYGKPS